MTEFFTWLQTAVQQWTALFKDVTGFIQAVLALLSVLGGIWASIVALRGRSHKSTRPAEPVRQTGGARYSSRQKNARLPELAQVLHRQEFLRRVNGLAGAVLLPVTVFTSAVYLIVSAARSGQSGDVGTSIGGIAVTLVIAGCWLVQRNLNPQWRSKQALARSAKVHDLIVEVEGEVERDSKSQERIRSIGSEALNDAVAMERDDIDVGV